MTPGRAKTTLAAFGRIEFGDLFPCRLHHRSEHQLGDAVAALDNERLGAEVDQDHLQLAGLINRRKGFDVAN